MRYRARLPPSASISFHLVRSLALSFSLIPVLRAASFLPDEFNSCRRRERGRTLNLPRRRLGRLALAYRFRCALPSSTPKKAFVHRLSISRAHALAVSVRRRIRVVRTADREARRINLFRSTVRAAAGSRELSSEHEGSGEADESEINNFGPFPLRPVLICVTKQ